MRFFTTFLIIILSAVCSYAQPSAIVDEIDTKYSALAATGRFNGTVLYAENGNVVYKKAFGVSDARTGEPLTTSSAFNLASVSKQFMAAGIMILFDEGKIQFDDNVKKYLPTFLYEGITIQHLLQHTSGIPDYFDLYTQNRTPIDSLTNQGVLDLYIKYQPELEFATGSSWNYSNTNYVLIAMIIEKISGQPLNKFMEEKIIKPAKLSDTYLYHIFMPTIPENHVYGFQTVNGKTSLNDLWHVDGVYGDGNMYSSVEDLFKWEQLLYTNKIVKQTTFTKALQPAPLSDGSTYPYGFGWFIAKQDSIFMHTGGWAGFLNLICRDVVKNRTLIVLTSGSSYMGIPLGQSLFLNKPFEIPGTTLIENVALIDGTGTPQRNTSVRIEGDRILDIGKLTPFKNEQVINGNGKVLAPGFIDTHSHVDRELNNTPNALAAISQGITTIVIGQDGESDPIDSLKKWCTTIPKSVNIASYTGHATIRAMVMGKDEVYRPATQEEIDQMKVLLEAELAGGSLGLSTGLEYEGGFYSTMDEIIQLAKTTAAGGGKYISHLRSEDIKLNDAIDEIITIGYEAKIPVQISHIKIALKDDWGTATQIIAKLETAREAGVDITADCYPYTYWNATIRVLFPNKDFTSMEGARYATTHLFDPSGSIMVRYKPNPEYAGKSISEIAAMRNESNEATLLYLIAAAEAYGKLHPEDDYIEAIMGKSMSDEDIIPFLTWTHTNVCSDGANGGHPRGYGAFTRVLGHYIREQQIMGLPTAINKMTALGAAHVGIKERGIIAPGYFADLVLLDPELVKDNADIENSKALSDGILMVWVNGEIVYQDKSATNRFPGVFLSK